ncbi:MAG: hypothetical protein ACJAYB_000088 [Psychromonas sp.]|jgi:hypothetical protein
MLVNNWNEVVFLLLLAFCFMIFFLSLCACAYISYKSFLGDHQFTCQAEKNRQGDTAIIKVMILFIGTFILSQI